MTIYIVFRFVALWSFAILLRTILWSFVVFPHRNLVAFSTFWFVSPISIFSHGFGFNLSLLFSSSFSGLKVRQKQCFCGMKGFLGHWVHSWAMKSNLDYSILCQLVEILRTDNALYGKDNSYHSSNGDLNNQESTVKRKWQLAQI